MEAESSTSHRKRRSLDTVALSPARALNPTNRTFKRVREATPIYEDSTSTDQEPELEVSNSAPNASTAPADITTATATTTDDGTSGQYLADDERRSRAAAETETSEKDEPSVLFSEHEATCTEPTEAVEDGSMVEDEETTMVAAPESKPSQHRPPRRESLAQPEEFKIHDPSMGGDVQGADDYADLPWMREQSDGIENLDEWMDPRVWEPEWDDYLDSLANDGERDLAMARQRYLARVKMDQELSANREEKDETNYPRTTLEQLAEGLAAGQHINDYVYHSGDTDDFEMDHRPLLERAGVKRDIKAFMESVDALAGNDNSRRDYQVVDRLGEGELILWLLQGIAADKSRDLFISLSGV